MIVTSNKSCAEWGDVLATAILDRLLHHCDVILSYPDTLASLRCSCRRSPLQLRGVVDRGRPAGRRLGSLTDPQSYCLAGQLGAGRLG
jgi:IstB-like ATP binding protein